MTSNSGGKWLRRLVAPAALAAAVAGVGAAASGRGEPAKPVAAADVVDVAKVRPHLQILTDGKSHYIAVAPPGGEGEGVFYGDGKTFYELYSGSSGSSDKSWELSFIDPRFTEGGHAEGSGFLSLRDNKYTVQCGQRTTELKSLDKAAAQTMLQAAAFLRTPRKYRPHALARDDRGRYYYVDQGFRKNEHDKFRLFVGPKGGLKQLQMTNVVSDSEGEIFSTKTGSLRLILDRKDSAAWIEREKPHKLTIVPVDNSSNVASIYNEFGVYAGERLGTPCDDL